MQTPLIANLVKRGLFVFFLMLPVVLHAASAWAGKFRSKSSMPAAQIFQMLWVRFAVRPSARTT